MCSALQCLRNGCCTISGLDLTKWRILVCDEAFLWLWKRGWCSETSEPCCFGGSVRSRAGRRGQTSRLDVKGESRGVDGWRGRGLCAWRSSPIDLNPDLTCTVEENTSVIICKQEHKTDSGCLKSKILSAPVYCTSVFVLSAAIALLILLNHRIFSLSSSSKSLFKIFCRSNKTHYSQYASSAITSA